MGDTERARSLRPAWAASSGVGEESRPAGPHLQGHGEGPRASSGSAAEGGSDRHWALAGEVEHDGHADPVEGDAGGEAQAAVLIVLESSVTAPVWARARPFNLAPVFRPMDVSARIFPIKEVVVPRVAELPILHQTLQGSPPVTEEPGDVMSVETVLNIHTPDPTRFRFPVSEKLLVEQ